MESAASVLKDPQQRYSILDDLAEHRKQHNISTWSIIYKPSEAFTKTLQEQPTEVIQAFTEIYRVEGYPRRTEEAILNKLNEVINKYSDQLRTPQPGPSRLRKLTQKATDAAKTFASEIVAPIVLGDPYPKKSTPIPLLDPTTPVGKTTLKDRKDIHDASKRMPTKTQRPRTRTDNISRYR